MIRMTAPTITKPVSGILRNTFLTSERTGIEYWVDENGKATPIEVERPFEMCECELDWNCPLHSNRMFTAIERINDEWASRETDIDAGWGMW